MPSSLSNGCHASAIFGACTHQGRSGSWIEGCSRSFEAGFSLCDILVQEVLNLGQELYQMASRHGHRKSRHFWPFPRHWEVNRDFQWISAICRKFLMRFSFRTGHFLRAIQSTKFYRQYTCHIVSTDVISSVHMSYRQYRRLIVSTDVVSSVHMS